MNQREKTLAIIVVGMLGFFVVALGLRAFFLKPLRDVDSRIAAAQERLETIRAERRAYFDSEDRMKEVARRTFADDVNQAAAIAGEMLTRHIMQCGLREADFTRLPAGPRRMRGVQEVGWSVQGEGPLSNIVDLLFGLQELPFVHRVENVVFAASEKPGLVRVRFRYLTLVFETPFDVTREMPDAILAFDETRRKPYEAIVQRDILRPYIKRPPPPPPATRPPRSTPETPPPPGPENFQIVSLTEWQGVSEIHVRDRTRQRTVSYTIGDELAGGEIVLVDYRPLPLRRNPTLQSHSRVILKLGSEFWAVERGQTLADKYLLQPEQLPDAVGTQPESSESESQ
jgi:hypothetical protein